MIKPELLVADFAGTTLREEGAVVAAYRLALTEHRIPFAEAELAARRGASKRAVFQELARLWSASLLLEEAEFQATSDRSYRKLLVAAEYLRRRLLPTAGDVWLGPRPAATDWFDAVVDWRPVPAEASAPLIGALQRQPSAVSRQE